MNTLGRLTRIGWGGLAVMVCALALLPSEVRADAESPTLTKYRGRVDRAVDRALAFLSRTQNPNGSYPGTHSKTNGVVGLVGMAFLSKGYRPAVGPYSTSIRRCIDYVLSTRQSRGDPGWLGSRGHGRMYSHAISTLFLSEVSGMVGPERQKKIDALLPKALKCILDAQNVRKPPQHAGGWRYGLGDSDSDLSVSGWNIMALRSARLNGAPVPADAIKKAIKYVDSCRSGNGFRYAPGSSPTPPMTAVGLLCRELAGHHADDVNRKAGDYLLDMMGKKVAGQAYPEYFMYYASQGMFQLGGKYWDQFGVWMYERLLPRQQTDGSWIESYGKSYPTAMYVLSLAVSYRQLPIYQR